MTGPEFDKLIIDILSYSVVAGIFFLIYIKNEKKKRLIGTLFAIVLFLRLIPLLIPMQSFEIMIGAFAWFLIPLLKMKTKNKMLGTYVLLIATATSMLMGYNLNQLSACIYLIFWVACLIWAIKTPKIES